MNEVANINNSAKDKLEEYMLQIGCEKLQPISIFSDGVYIRKVFMPANTPLVLGHEHKTRHLNVVVSGLAIVSMERNEPVLIKAGDVFESEPGVRKALWILQDMEYMTIHPNPENVTSEEELEEIFIDKTERVQEWELKQIAEELQQAIEGAA